MDFKPSRASAIEKLDNFINHNLSDYSNQRNFDYGPEKRSNVSCLSPYITHGIINEKEVINKSLKKFSFGKTEARARIRYNPDGPYNIFWIESDPVNKIQNFPYMKIRFFRI